MAYRLYALCERQNWASESQVYNNLVTSWPEILKLLPEVAERQMRF